MRDQTFTVLTRHRELIFKAAISTELWLRTLEQQRREIQINRTLPDLQDKAFPEQLRHQL